MFQRKYLIFLSTLAVLAILWCAGWYWLAGQFRSDIEKFAVDQRERDLALEWESFSITGFPVRFHTMFNDPRARWQTPERVVTWSGADTVIRPFVEGTGAVAFRAPGLHSFEIVEPDGTVLIQTRSDTLEGRIGFDDGGRMEAVRGAAEPFRASIESGGALEASRLAFDWTRAHARSEDGGLHPDGPAQVLKLVLDNTDLSAMPLDASVADTLGQRIGKLAFQLTLRGDLDPVDISPDRLALWRDAGGTLEADQVTLRWGPVRFAGAGTLSLDEELQPVGAFNAEIAGLDTVIDLLETRGQIRAQQAAIARIALAVLTRAPANGGPPVANVPVTIQNRVLSVGPVPLLELEPVTWD